MHSINRCLQNQVAESMGLNHDIHDVILQQVATSISRQAEEEFEKQTARVMANKASPMVPQLQRATKRITSLDSKFYASLGLPGLQHDVEIVR